MPAFPEGRKLARRDFQKVKGRGRFNIKRVRRDGNGKTKFYGKRRGHWFRRLPPDEIAERFRRRRHDLPQGVFHPCRVVFKIPREEVRKVFSKPRLRFHKSRKPALFNPANLREKQRLLFGVGWGAVLLAHGRALRVIVQEGFRCRARPLPVPCMVVLVKLALVTFCRCQARRRIVAG